MRKCGRRPIRRFSTGSSEKKVTKDKKLSKKIVSITPPEDSLSADLLALRDNPDTCDMVFIVGKERKKFPAHKFVIAVNSELGVRLFAKGESEIDVPDVEPEVFKYVLDACYSSFMHFPTDVVPAVRNAAKAYGLDSVAKQLSKYMTTELNIANCVDMYEHNEELLNDADFGVEFILENFKKVAKHKSFKSMSEPKLLRLVKQDTLRCSESMLVEAVVEWARAQLDSGKAKAVEESKEEDGANVKNTQLRHVLQNIVPYLRLGSMTPHGVSRLARMGLFSNDELLNVYTYIISKKAVGEKKSLPKCMFGTERREAGGFTFQWGRTGDNGAIEDDGLSFACNNGGYCCALGNTAMEPGTGQYYWQVDFVSMGTSSWQGGLGVGLENINLSTYMTAGPDGWGYISHARRAHQSGSGEAYGTNFATGSKVGCLFDSDTGSLYFWHNDQFHGLAYSGINQTVYPLVHLSGNGRRCRIVEDAVFPDNFDP